MLNRSNKNIEFIAQDSVSFDAFTKPYPALKNIPSWHKNMKATLSEEIILNESGDPARTIKACMPVFDSMTAGYYIPLPADTLFHNTGTGIETQWSIDVINSVSTHSLEQIGGFKIPENFYQVAFKFHNPWIIKTPPGYSCLIMHPMHRDDLPFYTLPGLVDTDKHPIAVNFPFFLKNNFSGILEMNTPIAQIIPFKRDEWESNYSYSDIDTNDLWQFAKRKIMNRYKTFCRSKKVWK